jgi:RNA polymerase sigma factor (sigma-70 family)
VKALESFDETSGNAFSTYAYPTILGYMRSLINRRGNWIRFPAHTVLLAQKISKLDLQEEAPQVIAQKLDQTVPYIEQALKYLRLRNIYSLDLPRRDSEKEEDDHHYLAKTEDDLSVTVVHDFLEKLPPKKRRILELTMQGYNRREIGRVFGLSHQAVWSHLRSIKKIYERTYVKEAKPVSVSELTKEQYLRMRLNGQSRTVIQKEFFPKNPPKFYEQLRAWDIKEKDAEEAALDLLQAELKKSGEIPTETKTDPNEVATQIIKAEVELHKEKDAEIERLQKKLAEVIGERNHFRDLYGQLEGENEQLRKRLEAAEAYAEGVPQSPTENDPINHPAHYTAGKVECIDAIESATAGLTGGLAYATGAAIERLWRWQTVEDLRLARRHIDRLVESVVAEGAE